MATKSLALWFVLAATISMATTQVLPTRRVNLGGIMIGDCSETLDLGVMIDGMASEADQRAALRSSGLVSESLVVGDTPPGTGPGVGVFDTQIVCTAAGRTRGTIGSISVVVTFGAVGVPGTPTGFFLNTTEQFQFDCTADDVFDDNTADGETRSSSGASLDTVRDDQCGQCVDPNSVSSPLDQADPDTHCLGCHSNCNQGMMKCIGTGADQCCNFFYEDQCVISCPVGLVGDSTTFECGCPSLSLAPNGDVTYSNMLIVGSVATHTCNRDGGYVLVLGDDDPDDSSVMELSRTCAVSGWSGEEITCQLFDCGSPVANSFDTSTGTVMFSARTFGSVASISCNSGYTLVGSASRTCELGGWSGDTADCVAVTEATTVFAAPQGQACNVGCIIGIVLAVLGAIILASVIAGVAYAIYSYKNHPDTKLAKYDPDNINGVARDNPLYVDPDAVVGDGAEAA